MDLYTVLAGLCGALIAGGLALLVYSLVPQPEQPPRPQRQLKWPQWIAAMPRWRQLAALVALAVGLVLAVTTGWVLLAALLPLAVIALPLVLASSDNGAQIERIDAIAEWTRNLAGVLTAGQGLEQALQASLRSCPDRIRPEVSQLIGRLRARWATETALRAFADDLDDATGDLVVAALILGARKRGDGLARVLTGLSESVADDVRARRQVEADRAKPRSNARMITLISAGGLVALALTGQFLAPYASPLGQVLLAVYLAGYLACAWWLQKMAAAPAPPRFIASRRAVFP